MTGFLVVIFFIALALVLRAGAVAAGAAAFLAELLVIAILVAIDLLRVVVRGAFLAAKERVIIGLIIARLHNRCVKVFPRQKKGAPLMCGALLSLLSEWQESDDAFGLTKTRVDLCVHRQVSWGVSAVLPYLALVCRLSVARAQIDIHMFVTI